MRRKKGASEKWVVPFLRTTGHNGNDLAQRQVSRQRTSRRPGRDFDPLCLRSRNELLRVRITNVEVRYHGRADSVDGPDVRRRPASIAAIATVRVEADAQDLDSDAGRLDRSVGENGAQRTEV